MFKDEIGKRYHRYTVLERMGKNKSRQYQWKCRCDCGKIKIVDGAALRNGMVKSCGCWQRDYMRQHHSGSKSFRWKGYKEIPQTYIAILLHSAKSRNLQFNLTKEYLWKLFLKQKRKCALSGLPLVFGNSFTEQTASLDRIDSSKNYEEGNVQWVEKRINKMKMNLTDKDFIFLCKVVTGNN